MTRVLVAYFSETGNTKALADTVVKGVRAVDGVECDYKPAADVTNDDLLAVDGVIAGSPTYFAQMAPEVKRMLDASEKIYGKLEGKVGGAFTTSGGAGCGHETTNMSILIAMLVSLYEDRIWEANFLMPLGITLIGSLIFHIMSLAVIMLMGREIDWSYMFMRVILPSTFFNLLLAIPSAQVFKALRNRLYPPEVEI